MPRPKKRQTLCPGCHGKFFQTTPKYSWKKAPRGKMFALLPKYKAQGWPEFHPDAGGGSLICPDCEESMLLSDGSMSVETLVNA